MDSEPQCCSWWVKQVFYVPLLQYFPISRAEPWSVPLPRLVKYRWLPARPQQLALPLTTLHPAGPWGQWRVPQPQRGQQHRKPTSCHDASRHRQLTGWVEHSFVFVCMYSLYLHVCMGPTLFDMWLLQQSSVYLQLHTGWVTGLIVL